MADEARSTLSGFLRQEIWRHDYRVLDDGDHVRTRFVHEQKLEQLHALCIRNRYRTRRDAESIRRQLYCCEIDESCPAALLLSLAYLPECVAWFDKPAKAPTGVFPGIDTTRFAQAPIEHRADAARVQTLVTWQGRQFMLTLPPGAHSILVLRDSALIAA